MNYKFYSDFLDTVDMYPKNINLACYTLGLLEEIRELEMADSDLTNPDNVLKEAGDVFWYGISILKKINRSPKDLNLTLSFDYNQYQEIAGFVKKSYRDDALNEYEDRIFKCVESALNKVHRIIQTYGFTIDLVLETNYMKLQSRKERGTLQGSGDNR